MGGSRLHRFAQIAESLPADPVAWQLERLCREKRQPRQFCRASRSKIGYPVDDAPRPVTGFATTRRNLSLLAYPNGGIYSHQHGRLKCGTLL